MTVRPRPRTGSRRAAALACVAALAAGTTAALPAVPVAAAPPPVRGTGTACPPLQVVGAGFVDVARSFFAREIGCLAAYGVAAGTSPTTYAPASTVSRAQMALFLYRLGSSAGVAWGDEPAGFTDTADLPPEERRAVDALAGAGVTQGRGDGRFDPAGTVTRGQMASFLQRLQATAAGQGFPAGPDEFADDDGDVHEDDIDAIAAAGISNGTGPDTFAPAAAVDRQQMAGFLARLLDVQVDAGRAASAYDRPCLPVRTWSAERLAGAVVTAPVRLDALDDAADLVASGVGGLLLYGSPSPQLAAQLARLRAAAPDGWPLLVASDEEGGAVQRLGDLTGRLPSPREMSAAGPDAVRATATALGTSLKALGVTVDLAPVAGLDDGPGPDATHPLGTRSFSADPQVAAADVVAFTTGLQDAGVLPSVKHFPGLGTASGNTDDGPATTADWSQLQQRDVLPFRAAVDAGARGLMTSNAVVPGLTDGQPTSLSGAATYGVLRQQYGFGGVLFTDSLSAAAISAAGYDVPSAAVRALVAGADDVLFGTSTTRDGRPTADAIRSAVVAAVGDGTLPAGRLRDAAASVAQGLGRTVC